MFKLFQTLVRYFGNLPLRSVTPTDRLVVYPPSCVPKNINVSDIMPFAHVSFDGDGKINSSFNVESVNRLERGIFKVIFSNSHSTGHYTLVATSGLGNHTSSARAVSIDEMTTTSCTVRVERTDTGSQENEGYTALILY